MRRKVIDSNQLQSEDLRSYLYKSDQNFAVLTDYVAMEAYRGDTLSSIFKSMEVISERPKQVIILKSTITVCGLRGRRQGLQRRLIDEAQTNSFAKYVDALRYAKRGNLSVEQQLLDHGKEATRHLERMLDDAQKTGQSINDIGKNYSKLERAAIRRGEPYTPEMVDKIITDVMHITSIGVSSHPKVSRPPPFLELPNTFIFRSALCVYLFAIFRAAEGSAMFIKPEKLRNDMVDANFVAYATYFDGILTRDCMVHRVYQEAKLFLSAVFDCHE